MHDIKEVARLRSFGLSQRMIAKQCRISRNTVQKFFELLDSKGLDYLQIKDFDDCLVQDLLENKKQKREIHYVFPDCQPRCKFPQKGVRTKYWTCYR